MLRKRKKTLFILVTVLILVAISTGIIMANNDMAALSNAAYNGSTPDGYQQVGTYNNPGTGYQGTAYKNNQTGQVTIASAGTNDWNDFRSNAQIVAGQRPEQANDLQNFTNQMHQQNPNANINYTGHSLGGAVSNIQAAQTGANSQTFGAPGTGQIAQGGGNITNNVQSNDPVTWFGQQTGNTNNIGHSNQPHSMSGYGAPNAGQHNQWNQNNGQHNQWNQNNQWHNPIASWFGR